MGDLEDVDRRQVEREEDRRLGVGGEEDGRGVGLDEGDDGSVVGVAGRGGGRRFGRGGRPEDGEGQRAGVEGLALLGGDDAGGAGGRVDGAGGRRAIAVAAVEEQGGGERAQDGGRVAVVVELRVGDDERVEAADAGGAELCDKLRSGRAGVDEDGVAVGLQERRVALADVERGDAQGSGWWRGDGRGPVEDERGERRDEGERRERAGAPAARRESRGGERRDDERRRHGKGRGRARDTHEVAERRTGERDERGRERRRRLAERGGGEAEPHDRRDRGRGEQVGGHGDERRAVEAQRDQRRGGEGGRQRHRDGLRRGARQAAWESVAHARGKQRDPQHGGEAQLPARVGGGARIEQERRDGREQEHVRAGRRAAGERGADRRRAHDPGALDRGAAAGQRNVERDEGQRRDPARTDTGAGDDAQREHERRQQRDVLPARGGEVAEADRGERVGDVVGQRRVVAEDHPAQQRGLGRREVAGERTLGPTADAVHEAERPGAPPARGAYPGRAQRRVGVDGARGEVGIAQRTLDGDDIPDARRRRVAEPRGHPDEHRLAAQPHEEAPATAWVGARRGEHGRLAADALADRKARGLQRGGPRLPDTRREEEHRAEPQRDRRTPHKRERDERQPQRPDRDDGRGHARSEQQANDDDREDNLARMPARGDEREATGRPEARRGGGGCGRGGGFGRGRSGGLGRDAGLRWRGRWRGLRGEGSCLPRRRAHSVTCLRRDSNFLGPMPGIWVRLLMEEKPPWVVR